MQTQLAATQTARSPALAILDMQEMVSLARVAAMGLL